MMCQSPRKIEITTSNYCSHH